MRCATPAAAAKSAKARAAKARARERTVSGSGRQRADVTSYRRAPRGSAAGSRPGSRDAPRVRKGGRRDREEPREEVPRLLAPGRRPQQRREVVEALGIARREPEHLAQLGLRLRSAAQRQERRRELRPGVRRRRIEGDRLTEDAGAELPPPGEGERGPEVHEGPRLARRLERRVGPERQVVRPDLVPRERRDGEDYGGEH